MRLIECINCRSSESIEEVVGKDNRVVYRCNICKKQSPQAISLDSRLKFDLLPSGEIYHHSIGVILTNEKSELLMAKRRFFDYTWSIIFGHIHNGETPEQAARRELIEETSINANNFKKLFTETFDTQCRTGIKKHRCTVFRVKVPDNVFMVADNESNSLQWVPIQQIKDRKYKPMGESTKEILKKLRLT